MLKKINNKILKRPYAEINRYWIENKLYQILEKVNDFPKLEQNYDPEIDDLYFLHKTITERKVSTVLEFGIGFSTIIMAHALNLNKKYKNQIKKIIPRKKNLFEIHSVDSSKKYLNIWNPIFKSFYEDTIYSYQSNCYLNMINNVIVSNYKKIPNIIPDLIYLDAPELEEVKGKINNLSMVSKNNFPIAADILHLEYFLQPGAFIIVDGRTTNSRFLINNLQRDWEYKEYEKEDISSFELIEKPIGQMNKEYINFTLHQ